MTVAMLRVDGRSLPGVSVTSQTGPALRLRQVRVQSVPEVSADGSHVPTDRDSFLAEVLLQWAELYASWAGLTMDRQRLFAGSAHGAPALRDTANFRSRMSAVLGDASHPVGAPALAVELGKALSRGFTACALDELPRNLLWRAGGHGSGARALVSPVPSLAHCLVGWLRVGSLAG